MLLLLLFFILVVISLLLIHACDEYDNGLDSLGLLLPVIFSVALGISIGFIMGTQIFEESDFQKMQYERTQLIEQYDSGNAFVYADIIEFDKNLYDIKKRSESLWTNWFYNKLIAEKIDYILYEDYDFMIGG